MAYEIEAPESEADATTMPCAAIIRNNIMKACTRVIIVELAQKGFHLKNGLSAVLLTWFVLRMAIFTIESISNELFYVS